jgi:putative membrane protein
LVTYAGILSLLLSLVAGAGVLNLWVFLSSFLIAILVSVVTSATAKLFERDTIATFRRTTAVIFAGDAAWLFCLLCGLVLSFLVGNDRPLDNALVFGAFVCVGLEFVIISGAFAKAASVSLPLAALHPLLTVMAFAFAGVIGPFSPYAAVFGLVDAAILVLFITAMKRRKTNQSYDAVHLFQAFMKTWAGGRAADLEEVIAGHAERTDVSTKVLRFQQSKGNIFILLPGVHPGPFHPIGSYNLPGLFFQKFAETGPVLVLHGPGGHERNLATAAETQSYAAEVFDFARSVRTADTPAAIRGPISCRVGQATVSSIALSRDALLTVSFAPLGSEDLETDAEEEISRLGRAAGLQVCVVDAHNSIEPRPELLDTHDPHWNALLEELSKAEASPFRIACANSNELGFTGRRDLTDTGISVLLLETGGRKWTLVLADANNAIPSLRGDTAAALEGAGYSLLEFCTSDSHDLAAKGLTASRGYQALGEATPPDEISRVVVELARRADSRLEACRYGSGVLVRSVNAFGAKALDEFERVTRSSIGFAKRYSVFATASTLSLLLLSLIL